MNYILIVLVGMVLIFFIVDMIAKIVSPDNSLGAGIIAAGMELIVGAFTMFWGCFLFRLQENKHRMM